MTQDKFFDQNPEEKIQESLLLEKRNLIAEKINKKNIKINKLINELDSLASEIKSLNHKTDEEIVSDLIKDIFRDILLNIGENLNVIEFLKEFTENFSLSDFIKIYNKNFTNENIKNLNSKLSEVTLESFIRIFGFDLSSKPIYQQLQNCKISELIDILSNIETIKKHIFQSNEGKIVTLHDFLTENYPKYVDDLSEEMKRINLSEIDSYKDLTEILLLAPLIINRQKFGDKLKIDEKRRDELKGIYDKCSYLTLINTKRRLSNYIELELNKNKIDYLALKNYREQLKLVKNEIKSRFIKAYQNLKNIINTTDVSILEKKKNEYKADEAEYIILDHKILLLSNMSKFNSWVVDIDEQIKEFHQENENLPRLTIEEVKENPLEFIFGGRVVGDLQEFCNLFYIAYNQISISKLHQIINYTSALKNELKLPDFGFFSTLIQTIKIEKNGDRYVYKGLDFSKYKFSFTTMLRAGGSIAAAFNTKSDISLYVKIFQLIESYDSISDVKKRAIVDKIKSKKERTKEDIIKLFIYEHFDKFINIAGHLYYDILSAKFPEYINQIKKDLETREPKAETYQRLNREISQKKSKLLSLKKKVLDLTQELNDLDLLIEQERLFNENKFIASNRKKITEIKLQKILNEINAALEKENVPPISKQTLLEKYKDRNDPIVNLEIIELEDKIHELLRRKEKLLISKSEIEVNVFNLKQILNNKIEEFSNLYIKFKRDNEGIIIKNHTEYLDKEIRALNDLKENNDTTSIRKIIDQLNNGFFSRIINSKERISSIFNNDFDLTLYRKIRTNKLLFEEKFNNILEESHKLLSYYDEVSNIDAQIGQIHIEYLALDDNKSRLAEELEEINKSEENKICENIESISHDEFIDELIEEYRKDHPLVEEESEQEEVESEELPIQIGEYVSEVVNNEKTYLKQAILYAVSIFLILASITLAVLGVFVFPELMVGLCIGAACAGVIGSIFLGVSIYNSVNDSKNFTKIPEVSPKEGSIRVSLDEPYSSKEEVKEKSQEREADI